MELQGLQENSIAYAILLMVNNAETKTEWKEMELQGLQENSIAYAILLMVNSAETKTGTLQYLQTS